MPNIISQQSQGVSEYNQASFVGGMNLLLDDTHLPPNQYRIGFNLRNRYDRLDPVLSSKKDGTVPPGVIQEMTTFGNYEIIFIQGAAFYKLFTEQVWHQIQGFQMDANAPRYWTKAIPIATTNYLRIAATITQNGNNFSDVRGGINLLQVAGATAGNIPGLLVQDNINQPRFIFLVLGSDGITFIPTTRVTQAYGNWSITFTDLYNTTVATVAGVLQDFREYVPIGNLMEFVDGVLYIVSKDGNFIYRSVSGRPLDFVVNVSNQLVQQAPFTMIPGGDATTTAYSVGVGPISCVRAMSDNSLFVSANGANFRVSKNTNPGAPLEFGEYTFVRTTLFYSNCLSDRAIIDTVGDTRFVDLTGVRSFNAVLQQQNEGRNSPFTASISGAFVKSKGTSFINFILQDANNVAAILFDNYELYAVNSIFGPAIAVYDTINGDWVGFDLAQVNGKRIKILTKIELAAQALFAVTEDNFVYQLYVGPGTDVASFRTVGVASGVLWAGTNVKLANPRMEVKLSKTRVILNNITSNCSCSFTPYINNRVSSISKITKPISFVTAKTPTTSLINPMSDVDTQLENILFSTPDCEQGWKVFGLFEWTGGSITQFSMELGDLTPQNPLNSQ